MVSKTIVAVMLVGAFGLLPVSAMTALDSGLEPVANLEERIQTEGDSVLNAIPTDRVEAAVDELLSCQAVVRLPITLVYWDILDHRDQNTAFLAERELENVVDTIEIPIYETVTETVWAPSGLLGFLEPITKEVTRVTGYETKEVVEEVPVNLDVRLDWSEEYFDFSDPHNFEILLPVPVGLGFLGDGGILDTRCNDETIYNAIPHFDADGHDGVAVYIGAESQAHHLDGWYMDVFSIDVAMAKGDDFQLPREGTLIAPSKLLTRVDARIANFMANVDAELAQSLHEREANAHSVAVEPESEKETQSGSQMVIPASTMAFVAIVASALVAAGMLTYTRLRK